MLCTFNWLGSFSFVESDGVNRSFCTELFCSLVYFPDSVTKYPLITPLAWRKRSRGLAVLGTPQRRGVAWIHSPQCTGKGQVHHL